MHIDVIGDGPDLVLIHGWSMHSGVWQGLLQLLSTKYRCHLVDLPGHGKTVWRENDFDLSQLLPSLSAQLPEKAVYLGWSLGGMIALAMADRYPNKVSKLIMLASTPSFVQQDGWSCAVEKSVFEQFANQLSDDQQHTLQRFLRLQAKGSTQPREVIKQLAEQIAEQHPPHADALKAGLACLLNWDLREQLAALTCPLQVILGEKDNLIPLSIKERLPDYQPNARIDVMMGLGHAPFISDAEQCQSLIDQFIHE